MAIRQVTDRNSWASTYAGNGFMNSIRGFINDERLRLIAEMKKRREKRRAARGAGAGGKAEGKKREAHGLP
jgi:hypothetical protein